MKTHLKTRIIDEELPLRLPMNIMEYNDNVLIYDTSKLCLHLKPFVLHLGGMHTL